jgi:probable rRNA maturation factor
MADLVNLQKKIKIETAEYKAFLEAVVTGIPEILERPFTVAFIDDDRMRQLNDLFRDKDSTTDVLSFPHEPEEFDPDKTNLGDIVISAEQAQCQADENGLTFATEIKQLILHGLLHLCGYDHKTDNGEMDARELELRNTLGII